MVNYAFVSEMVSNNLLGLQEGQEQGHGAREAVDAGQCYGY